MNPFTVLELPPDATPEDIKAAYHRLAKRWHPDRFAGAEKEEAETKFRELAEAFSILKDPAKRLALQQQMPKVQPAEAGKEPLFAQERTPEDWATSAKAALDEGKVVQARALIHYAIRLNDKDPQYHVLLASILEQEGEDRRAIVKALETAVRLAPRDVESHIRLAGHFESLGLAVRAQRHLQIAREISPHHPMLRAALKKRAASTKDKAAPAKQAKIPGPLQGPLDQLMNLWSRLTGKG